MRRNKRGSLAFRETFLAGRIGIRRKILVYLLVLAGFFISMVWLLQNAMFYYVFRMPDGGARPPASIMVMQDPEQAGDALPDGTAGVSVVRLDEVMRWQFVLIVAAILVATGMVGYTMAKSISEPIIETNEAARELGRARYQRPPHSGGYREIAQLNDTLVQTAEDLRKVEDLQRELIANISHDLRTPLTMIEGYAEAMRDIPDENTPENMQIIIDETERLSTMVNEVLDFSRLRTGSLELTMTRFNLTELVRKIVDRISHMTAVEGYTVTFEAAEDVFVTADSGRISQVIYNLAGNALTYTGADKAVRIRQERKDGMVRITITDSGEGIPPEELPFIWDRYYRSRENHKRAVIGSGLGLNICRGILENHHAPYGAETPPEGGTVFWFALPEDQQENGL
ncbi:MAG: HAMP domain-containing histidine kinase [Clostridia bacterium]|nr:HAMP domain-containing histidine kinase [Clostridia bacterium]